MSEKFRINPVSKVDRLDFTLQKNVRFLNQQRYLTLLQLNLFGEDFDTR